MAKMLVRKESGGRLVQIRPGGKTLGRVTPSAKVTQQISGLPHGTLLEVDVEHSKAGGSEKKMFPKATTIRSAKLPR